MQSRSIQPISKFILVAVSLCLVASLFAPLWRIELDAPQYPEGLALQIWANKLAGDVDIINGLNHYIGMQTLHTENFIEFTILPYIIIFFAIVALAVAVIAKRGALLTLLISFVVFGIVSMVDFYRWNYNYGHNLDPNAAIQVPGMAYQPPILGFKQLLNFGAFSIPDIGGWLFILAGVLLSLAVFLEYKPFIKKAKYTTILILPFVLFQTACSQKGPVPVKFNADQCGYCKMTITEPQFACELITTKGRVYKFDDLHCLKKYLKNQPEENADLYVANFTNPENFLPLKSAFLLKGGTIKSPMGGHTAAFESKSDAENAQKDLQGELINWE